MRYCFLNIFLCSVFTVNAQKPPVRFMKAKDIIALAKESTKPYTWVVVYVPKCARAGVNFDHYMQIYKPNEAKLQLALVSILISQDNIDSMAKFSRLHGFETPVYVMDSSYQKDDIGQTPERFLKDLSGLLQTPAGFYEHIIIDHNGKLVYKSETLDFDDKTIRKYLK